MESVPREDSHSGAERKGNVDKGERGNAKGITEGESIGRSGSTGEDGKRVKVRGTEIESRSWYRDNQRRRRN